MTRSGKKKPDPAMVRSKWGLPNWELESEYPFDSSTTSDQWRWQWTRRRPHYRSVWEEYKKHFPLHDCGDFTYIGLADSIDSDPFPVDRWDVIFALRSTVLVDPSIITLPEEAFSWIYGISDGPVGSPGSLLFATREIECHAFENGLVNFTLDLYSPLSTQLERLAVAFKALQKDPLHGVADKGRSRPRIENWTTYLRALDARDCGASLSQISEVLWPRAWNGGKITKLKARDCLLAAEAVRDNYSI